MLLTRAEIDALRLCGLCKDLPSDSRYIRTPEFKALENTGLLYFSRNGQNVRLTDEGRALLEKAGYVYEKDKTVRSVGSRLTKRLETAELMLFLFQGKTDVFCSAVPDRNNPPSFLPSFTLRREKTKILLVQRDSTEYFT